MTPGKLVQRARKAIRPPTSQDTLGKLAGLAKGHLCRIESDEYAVTIATLEKIAAAMNSELLIQFVKNIN